MGGKDCIVVDETADVDAAAEGIVAAAFGFQGQKCSACSRAIVHRDIYDAVLERVVERAKKLTVGDTTSDENLYMGAVIDEAAYKKINEYIEIGKKEGRMVLGDWRAGCPPHPAEGRLFHPADDHRRRRPQRPHRPGGDLRPGARGHQGARTSTTRWTSPTAREFGLTGALYSADRFRLERARHEFHVGNLYFNRKCTGALVDVQPFGGFNMSGTDSKAGGRDYLLLFMQGKSIAERL